MHIMNNLLHANRFAALLLLVLFTFSPYAQKVGNEVFLKGTYLEVGVNECGVFGTDNNATIPGGYHPRANNPGLGFVADPDQDGWTTGTPDYCGDYFIPGTPEEGWGVEFNGVAYGNFDQSCSQNDIPFSNITYTNTINNVSAGWEGGVSGLDIRKTTSFPKNGLFFVTQVVLTNTTGSTMNDVYYMRSVDPDNEQPITGDYTTRNTVIHQPTAADSTALVEAVGLVYGCYLGLGTLDDRARVSHGGFFNRDASDVYTGVFNTSGTVIADQAISLAFYFGDMAPGQSVSFAYAYVLDSAQLAVALGNTVNPPQFLVGGVNVTTADTAEICPGVPVDIEITNGNAYTWTWSPGTDLSDSTGTLVTANLTVPQRTYTITGISAADTVVKVLTLKAVGIPVLSASNLNVLVTDPAFVLNHATPAGGSYSGPGVSIGNVFNPAAVGVGVYTIKYKYTVAAGCSDSIDFQITVSSAGGCFRDSVVSDSIWAESTYMEMSGSGDWFGASILPAEATYILAAQIGQPYVQGARLRLVPGSLPIQADNNIRFFTKTFNLSSNANLSVRLRMFMDDDAEVYLNGHMIAREENIDVQNFKGVYHDIFYHEDDSVSNAYKGGQAFDTAPSLIDMDSVLNAGANKIVVVVRNLRKANKGGFSMKLDITDCGDSTIIQKSGGLTEAIAQGAIELYPNPTTGRISVALPEIPGGGDYQLRLFDMSGRLLEQRNLSSSIGGDMLEMNIGEYSSGMYILSVQSGDKYSMLKISKQ